MCNGENVGSKDPPNYLREPVSNAHSSRPAIEAVESVGGAAQRPPKFDACGPVVDHPPRMCGFRAKWGTDSDGKWGGIPIEVGRGSDGKWGTF